MLLKPDIHLTYQTRIWNIYTAGANFLLLELRDDQTLSASFDLYNIHSKSYQWQDLILQENWRIGVSHCTESIIIFHRYESGTVPAIDTLFGYDLKTGKEKWQQDNVQPVDFGVQYIKGILDDHEVYVDIISGEIANEVDNFFEENIIERPVVPLNYTADSTNFVPVKKFVEQYFNYTPVGPAEYLEYHSHIFLSFHIKKDKGYEIRLVALTKSGNIWLDQKVDGGDKYFSDIFFIWTGHLFFIEGKHQLKAIKLKQE